MPFIHIGEPRSLAEHIADLPMLTRHLWRYFWNGDGIRILFRLRILLFLGMGVFYLLLPFDLLPEVVFGIFGKFKTNYVISYSLTLKYSINCLIQSKKIMLQILPILGLLDDIIVIILMFMWAAVIFRNVVQQNGMAAQQLN